MLRNFEVTGAVSTKALMGDDEYNAKQMLATELKNAGVAFEKVEVIIFELKPSDGYVPATFDITGVDTDDSKKIYKAVQAVLAKLQDPVTAWAHTLSENNVTSYPTDVDDQKEVITDGVRDVVRAVINELVDGGYDVELDIKPTLFDLVYAFIDANSKPSYRDEIVDAEMIETIVEDTDLAVYKVDLTKHIDTIAVAVIDKEGLTKPASLARVIEKYHGNVSQFLDDMLSDEKVADIISGLINDGVIPIDFKFDGTMADVNELYVSDKG